MSLLRDALWDHFTRTALVTETDEEEHKMRRAVKKIGLDPHFSFSFMMACAAWCRANGTGSFIMPNVPEPSELAAKLEKAMPGLPASVVAMIESPPSGTCGACSAFANGECTERGLRVLARDPGCVLYIGKG